MPSEPIRILQVVTSMRRGGIETMLMNYYRRIDRDLVQFDFLVHRGEPAHYDAEILSLGGKIHRVRRLIPGSPLYEKQLGDFFDSHPEYRVVHSHLNSFSSVVLRVARKHGVPIRIAHSHIADFDRDFRYPVKMYCKRLVPRYATHMMACSKDAGKWIFGDSPFFLLRNAIQVDAFTRSEEKGLSVREELGIAKDALVVGNVGRFAPQKNRLFLVEAFAELRRLRADAVLLLVGDGIEAYRRQVEQRIEELNIQDSVLMLGSRSDVNELLQAMDVFAFPSLYEGLGIVVVEAQAAGVPCVITDTIPAECDVTDLVQRVSLKKSAREWAQAFLDAADTPKRNTAPELIRSGYDIKENAELLSKFYRELWSHGESKAFPLCRDADL